MICFTCSPNRGKVACGTTAVMELWRKPRAQLMGRCRELNCPTRGRNGFGERRPMIPKDIPYLSSTMENCSRPVSGSAPDTIDKGTQSLTSLLTHCLQIKGYFSSLHSVKYGFNQLQQQKNHTHYRLLLLLFFQFPCLNNFEGIYLLTNQTLKGANEQMENR